MAPHSALTNYLELPFGLLMMGFDIIHKSDSTLDVELDIQD